MNSKNCISLAIATIAIACALSGPSRGDDVKPTVAGSFKGNGKEANLAYVSAHWREPFDDKPSIALVFTAKDHSKDKKPDFDAAFGKYGSALIVSLHEDGTIFGCEVVHTALKKQNFSSVGKIKATNFKYADGKVEGELTTEGEDEFFGDTWEVKDLKFTAPLGPIPAEFQPKAAKKPEKESSSDSDADDSSEATEKKAPAAPEMNVKDLALTKDATDFEYKALVEQMSFKSPSSVKNVCAELAKNLKAQGWKGDGSDLVNPKSSILRRKRGAASLTIFVKPDGAGSEVKLMTEGLSWDGQ
jgi:hypothetical protein